MLKPLFCFSTDAQQNNLIRQDSFKRESFKEKKII